MPRSSWTAGTILRETDFHRPTRSVTAVGRQAPGFRAVARVARTTVVILGLALGVAELLPNAAHPAEPSPQYRAELQRTLELRRQRRRARGSKPPGVIAPWPMPPALVIRQRPETHDEIGALLRLLRHGGR